jgi:hypothetical protein
VISLTRWLIGAVVALVVLIIAGAVAGTRAGNRVVTEREEWKAKYEAAVPRLEAAIARGDTVQEQLATRDAQLEAAITRSRGQASTIGQLRQQRQEIPVVSSVPGLPPSVGDTLAQCRLQLSICDQESKLAEQRGNELEAELQETKMQLGSFRSDVFDWQQTARMNASLLEQAQRQLAAADAPCYLWKLGPARVNCLGRKDAFALGAAGALLATSQFVDDKDTRRKLQGAGGVLIVGSIVIW